MEQTRETQKLLERAREIYGPLCALLLNPEEQRAALLGVIALRLAGRIGAWATIPDGQAPDFDPDDRAWRHLINLLQEAGLFLDLAERWAELPDARINNTLETIADEGWPDDELERLAGAMLDRAGDNRAGALLDYVRTLHFGA